VSIRAEFQHAFEAMPEAQLLLDRSGTIQAASAGYCRATGLERTLIHGKALKEVPPYQACPAASEQLGVAAQTWWSATGVVPNALSDARPLASGVHWQHGSTYPVLDDQGQVTHVVHRLEESLSVEGQQQRLEHEMRRSHDQLRVALVAARALSWDRDLLTGTSWYSSDIATYFGVPPGTQPIDADSLVHAEDRAEVMRAHAHALATGEDLSVEFRGPERGPVTRRYASRGQVFRDSQKRSVRMVGVTWDITEMRRLREERLMLEHRMQEGQKLESLGVLAGGIAHDFNNLLMTIMGNASLLHQEVGHHPGTALHVRQIEEASRRASDLCKQMLAYAGKGRFVLTRTHLNQLIEETTHLVQVSISKKVVLRFHLYQGLPAIIADVTQIRQVLMNLVMNASDAIGERSGVVSISTGVVRADRAYLDKTFLAPEIDEGDYVFLEVSDTGRGMTPETQARIFEPFFSTKAPGRGLGLAAVLGIVRGHKGALKVYSELGKGSSFKFLLPIANETLPRFEDVEQATRPLPCTGTVLVVDDEETLRAVASQMVEALGLRVLNASDGREAVQVYAAHATEIVGVLMDLTMPHMDGEEAFRELRRVNPNVRVLLMSGYNEQDAIARFVGKGLAGFIQKPFNLDELQDRLRSLLS
jgi:two-component system cell cycle sensor histidine kinase/response regulator CckA